MKDQRDTLHLAAGCLGLLFACYCLMILFGPVGDAGLAPGPPATRHISQLLEQQPQNSSTTVPVDTETLSRALLHTTALQRRLASGERSVP